MNPGGGLRVVVLVQLRNMIQWTLRWSQGGGTSTAEEHDSVNPGGGLRVVVLVQLRNMIQWTLRWSQGGGTSTAEEHDSVNPGGGLRVVVLVQLRNMIQSDGFAIEWFKKLFFLPQLGSLLYSWIEKRVEGAKQPHTEAVTPNLIVTPLYHCAACFQKMNANGCVFKIFFVGLFV